MIEQESNLPPHSKSFQYLVYEKNIHKANQQNLETPQRFKKCYHYINRMVNYFDGLCELVKSCK